MSDDEDETHCPLCVEEMDLSDQNFLPCPCGYRVCMWCWHHIRENLNGLCPACRTPYNADPHAFSAVDREEIIKKNRERKLKEKQERKVTDRPIVSGATPVKVISLPAVVDRKHLHNYRVVQRNLVYVIGVPVSFANEELLRKPEYFGQYGKIGKVVIHRNHSSAHTTVSAYVTFVHREDAKASIQSLDGYWMDGHVLRASFGTTKYCNNFIRGVPCNNPECVYLHDLGDDDDRFTKEEIQAGHSKIVPVPGRDQVLVTGNGGPSGTGKKPIGEPVLPPPVFIQDNNSGALSQTSTSNTVLGSNNNTIATIAGNSTMSLPTVPPRSQPVSRSSSTTTSGNNVSNSTSNNTWNLTSSGLTAAAVVMSNYNINGLNVSSNSVDDNNSSILCNSISLDNQPSSSATANSSGLLPSPPPLASTAIASPTSNSASTKNNLDNLAATVLKRSASSNNSLYSSTIDSQETVSFSAAASAKGKQMKTSSSSSKETTSERKTLESSNNNSSYGTCISTDINSSQSASSNSFYETETNSDTPSASLSSTVTSGGAAYRQNGAPIQQQSKIAASSVIGGGASKGNSCSIAIGGGTTQSYSSSGSNSATETSAIAVTNIAADVVETTPVINTHSDKVLPPLHLLPTSAAARNIPDDTAAVSHHMVNVSKNTSNNAANQPNVVQENLNSNIVPQQQQQNQRLYNLLHGHSSGNVSSFNGFSSCAVFPVPVSSLAISVWANILQSSNDDLRMNPYGQLLLPFAEIIDLTLPPVDAICLTPWPRALSYYRAGMSPDIPVAEDRREGYAYSHTPAGRHIHGTIIAHQQQHHHHHTPPLPPHHVQYQAAVVSNISNSTGNSSGNIVQQQQQLQKLNQQYAKINSLLNAIDNSSSSSFDQQTLTSQTVVIPQSSNNLLNMTALNNIQQTASLSYSNMPHHALIENSKMNSNSSNNNHSNINSNNSSNNNNSANVGITALRQLFPGVKMSVGTTLSNTVMSNTSSSSSAIVMPVPVVGNNTNTVPVVIPSTGRNN